MPSKEAIGKFNFSVTFPRFLALGGYLWLETAELDSIENFSVNTETLFGCAVLAGRIYIVTKKKGEKGGGEQILCVRLRMKMEM